MHYQTYEPSKDWIPYIKCYWTLESQAEQVPKRQTIVPDGCIEMIFHFGDVYQQYVKDAGRIVQPRCFVMGQLTRPLLIEPLGQTNIFAVRFRPNGFLPFATTPIKALENTAVPLEQLFRTEGITLQKKMLELSCNKKRIEAIEHFLTHQLALTGTIDRVVQETVDLILKTRGQLPIEVLAQQAQINRRQLERKFATAIGLSPKQLSKTIRLQTTLHMLLTKQSINFTKLAYEGEYYDQAHFIKDFREFTGCTPRAFFDDQLRMTSFFIAD